VKIIDEKPETAWNYFLEVLFVSCFLNALPIIGFIKNGKLCFAHIPALATEGTTISSLDEFAALRIVFATFSGLNIAFVECLEKFSKDGWSNKGESTIIGLTTVRSTPVPESSCFNPSENPSMAN